jgi:hypothetical protein
MAESSAKSPLAQKLRLGLRIAGAVFGWCLFVAWWRLVLRPRTTPQEYIKLTVLQLTLAALGIALVTAAWIVHNLRIARRNRRGRVSPYSPPQLETDYLGRPLVLPPEKALRSAPRITVSVENGQKVYRPKTINQEESAAEDGEAADQHEQSHSGIVRD